MAAAMLLFSIAKSLLILAVVSLFDMVGVALNPGQAICETHRKLNQINFGLINACSAVNKAAIINIINDEYIDVLAISETWVQKNAPDAVKLDIASPGYTVVHAHRKSDVAKRGGGLAVVYRDNIRVKGPINTGISFAEFELLVITVCCSQRSINIALFTRLVDLSRRHSSLNFLIYWIIYSYRVASLLYAVILTVLAVMVCFMIVWMTFSLLIT